MARIAIEQGLDKRLKYPGDAGDTLKRKVQSFVEFEKRKSADNDGIWTFNDDANTIDEGKCLSNVLEAELGYRMLTHVGVEAEEQILKEVGEEFIEVMQSHGWSGVVTTPCAGQ